MRRLLFACLALALLSACRIETTVGVHAEADGSGRLRVAVTLDRAAAEQVPDLAEQLRTDDLRAAGWEVAAPRKTDDGGLAVEASKRFRSPGELTQAVEELSGPNGPFRDFRLQRRRSFLKTKTTLTGTVDLQAGLEGFGDRSLRDRLGGSTLGFDPDELESRLGTALDRIFVFRVAARLPGAIESNAPTETGDGALWRPTLGETVTVAATAEQWNGRTLGAAVVSGLAAAALVAVLVRRRAGPGRPASRFPRESRTGAR